jgi:tripartite-type tricarboxylate transporter receptor subunit TctC
LLPAVVAVALIAFGAVADVLAQQPFPSRTITLVVPFPPGGSTDTVARIMAEKMQPILGQPVIIENVGGAGGTTAVGRVARAAPDGYTIDIGQWDPMLERKLRMPSRSRTACNPPDAPPLLTCWRTTTS